MSDRAQQIQQMHAEYVRLTGYEVTLMGREYVWWEWLKRELTLADLRALVADTRSKIGRGELTMASLQFRNLIGQVDYAEEKIAELRARQRGRRPVVPDRESVLRQTGRMTQSQPQAEPRPAADVVAKLTTDPAAAEKALAELRALKDRL